MIDKLLAAVADAFCDPDGSTSMTRICALGALLVTAYAVHLGRDSATIGLLMGGGVCTLLARTRTQ